MINTTIRPEPAPVLRESRRTTQVTIGPDTIELCEPECRNEFLLDLGVRGHGAWVYAPSGGAGVHVAWSQRDYVVTWKRRRTNARPCDLCSDAWQYRIPAIVAAARARSEAMKGSLTPGLRPFSHQGAALGASEGDCLRPTLRCADFQPEAAETANVSK